MSVSTSSNATLDMSANVVDSMVEDCRKPASYTPPSHKTIEDLCRRAIHQPDIPSLTMLMDSVEWQQGINNLMSVELMAAAGFGLARMDKGKSTKNEMRILRNIVLDPITGKLIDNVLQQCAPMQFELFKILMEKYDFQDVTCQKMDGQEPHCDPRAHDGKPENEGNDCHVLITMQEEHNLLVSTSSKIQVLGDRFKTWPGRRASVKVGDEQLDDIYIIPRQGERPFMAIHQWLLGGNTTGASSEEPVTLHAGLSFGIPGTGNRWITPQQLIQIKRARAQEFRRVRGPGIKASVSMLANFLGTPEAAAEAVAIASTQVLRMFTLTKVTLPIATRIHIQDLAEYQDKYDAGKISNLSFKSQGYWSDGRKAAHKERCVGGGGSEAGRMAEGTAKDEFVEKCVAKGGSKAGRMAEGTAKDEFVEKCEAKGAIKAGRMAGTELADHRANIVSGFEKSNTLLFQLANGKKDQEHKWTVSSHYRGTASIHTFINGIDKPINSKITYSRAICQRSSPKTASWHLWK
jgi:hypothetical protein